MSEFARNDLIDPEDPSKKKKVFSDGDDGVFVLDSAGKTYRFSIEDDDINLYEDNILGDNLDLGKAMGSAEILNFNKVKTISKGAFESLILNGKDLEFDFEGQQIRIEEEAFGENFQTLKKIKGLNGRLNLLLYNNCFKKFKDIIAELEFENVDIYLYGKGWSKENIAKIIEHIGDGKIYAPEGEGKFEIAEKFDKLDADSLSKLSKSMIDAIVENISDEDKKEAKAIKNQKKKEGKFRTKEKKGCSWDKFGAMRMAAITVVIEELKKNEFTIKADIDVNKASIKDGKLELTEGCFNDISLICDSMKISDVLKLLCTKGVNGQLLKDDKNNRDKAKQAVKDYIMKNWTYVTKQVGIDYIILMNNEDLAKLTQDPEVLSKIRQENNIAAKVDVENTEDAKQNISNLMAAVSKIGSDTVFLTEEECKRMRKSYILIGKEYKHKNKKIALQCKKCIEDINAALAKGPVKAEDINSDLKGNMDKAFEDDSENKKDANLEKERD